MTQRFPMGARASAAAALATIVFSSCAFGQNANPRYFYTYHKQPLAIEMDVHRVAVLKPADPNARADQAASAAAALAPFTIDVKDVSATVMPGWSMAGLQGPARTPDDIEMFVARVAAAGTVDFVSPVFMNEYGPIIITPDLLIGFAEGVSPERAEQIINEQGIGVIRDRDLQGMKGVYRVRSNAPDGGGVLARANQLSLLPEIRYAEPDMIMTCRHEFIPNDPLFPQQWGLRNTGQSGGTPGRDMKVDQAWDITTGDPSIIVVIIDDGIQQNHPDINQRPGMDFTGAGGNGDHANPCDRHGTSVAGCVSAIMNNSIGVAGVCPGCRVAAAKFNIANVPCDGAGSFSISGLTDAINWSVTIGARVTNNSNGFGQSNSIDDAYTTTRNAGVVHFASTGNGGNGSIGYPSSSPSVNSVGSVNRFGNRSSFSQFGTGLDFSAPGESIVTTDRTGADGFGSGDNVTVDGTSFSSPNAAAVAALMLSRNNTLTPTQVETIMGQTATDLGSAGYDTTFGWGLLNANAAVALGACGGVQGATGLSFSQQPMDQGVAPNHAAMFSVTMSGTGPITYQWRKNNVDLINSGHYQGVYTSVLTVSPAGAADAGVYTCVASNACGPVTSAGATLALTTPCADLNGDGMVNATDLSILLGSWGPTMTFADLNGDGVANSADLAVLLGSWGPCP